MVKKVKAAQMTWLTDLIEKAKNKKVEGFVYPMSVSPERIIALGEVVEAAEKYVKERKSSNPDFSMIISLRDKLIAALTRLEALGDK